ncbi:MAG: AMP-binding protein [Flavobacteriales bacterium]
MRNYSINNREFTRSELEEFCWKQVQEAPEWERNHCMFILEWLSDKPELTSFTSGSTGLPKEIKLPRAAMERSALLTGNYFKLDQKTHALLALPSNYIAGKMMIVRALVNGWHLHWVEPQSNPLLHFNEPLDFAAFTAMQIASILQDGVDKLQRVRKILIGGGSISDGMEKALAKCTNEIYASYGMTETITHVALRAINGDKASKSFQALPGVRFSTTSDNRLVIEAPHVSEKKIITNDIVQLSSPFTFQFVGRADNVINSGGIKVFPEKIEEKIAHLLSSAFYIAAEPDDILGERVILYLEGEPLSDTIQLQLVSTMKIYLAPYEVPKKIYFVPKFERTATQKILRKDQE